EREVKECADDLSIKALVMHELRGWDVLRIEGGYGAVSKLSRLVSCEVIDPYISWRIRCLMGNQQLAAIQRKFLLMRNTIDSVRHGELLTLQRLAVGDVDVSSAVFINRVGKPATVRRENTSVSFP